MTDLTDDGRRMIAQLATRHSLSTDTVEAMARAMARGGGTMAQFNIPELGGGGQWMMGGMTMVGDMFDIGLKNTVVNLCGDLSSAMKDTPFFHAAKTSGGGWPPELGNPAVTGGQNAMRYAYFPQARRVVIDPGNGRPMRVLDSGEHAIGGFSQQQSNGSDPVSGLSFTSQFGRFSLMSLPEAGAASTDAIGHGEASGEPTVSSSSSSSMSRQGQGDSPNQGSGQAHRADPSRPETRPQPTSAAEARASQPSKAIGADIDTILSTIERLAKLHEAGVLSDEEFAAKKTELLARL